MTEKTALERVETTAITVQNPRVQAIAKRLRMGTEKLIKRIEAALPTVVEQQLYLFIARETTTGLRPESLAKLLRKFVGENSLQVHDLEDVEVGKNLFTNRFMDIADQLRDALYLLNKILLDFPDVNMSMEDAATLVVNYGPDGAENIIDSIAGDVTTIAAYLNLKNSKHEGKIISIAISYLVDQIIPLCNETGLPLPQDLPEYLASDTSSLRRRERS